MGKILLWSDNHVHPHKKNNQRLEDCLKALEWVFETAERRNIKNLLFGGDLFHDRQKIEVYTYQKTFEVFAKWMKKDLFNLYLLLGNHDLWFNDKTTISSVMPLSSLKNVYVISKPSRIEIDGHNWDFIPYTHNPIESLEELKKINSNMQYALGHIALDGAILHGSQQSDVSIEHDGDMIPISAALFDDYTHTFLGHYHAEQRVNKKVEYIGSPLQLSFGEAFQKKHIIVFDADKNEKEYIENDFSPKHLIISMNDLDKHQLDGNYVQIKVNDFGATDLIDVKKELLENNKLASLEIKQIKKTIDEHIIHDAKAILYKGNEMLEKYADQVGHEGLDREKLLKTGSLICQYSEQ
jgi:DNA repair exonuclease SbcCD nuclease subunit